ncbi:hypothetical protein HRbin28_00101 [bacterium HR28]|nr:hypothetical protein HRbin28_00101 [bacterium HR28]
MSQPLRPSHLIKPKTGPDDPELQETLLEGLQQVAPDDILQLSRELQTRRQRLLPLLATLVSGAPVEASTTSEIATAVTATRRQAEAAHKLLARLVGCQELSILLAGELSDPSRLSPEHGTGPVEERLRTFLMACGQTDRRLALELATGLLHLAAPRRYWLWTRWLWDIQHGTGILPLLASSTRALQGDDIGMQYRQLGAVIAMGTELGRNSGLLPRELADDPESGPFATDAFLAIAYSIYLYGITNWRLSREFNRLLPSLPDLARRLLGLPRPALTIG